MQLHETQGYKHKGDVETAMGAAVEAMGPEAFLGVLPLQLDNPVCLSRLFVLIRRYLRKLY
jgi:hypothetical protein